MSLEDIRTIPLYEVYFVEDEGQVDVIKEPFYVCAKNLGEAEKIVLNFLTETNENEHMKPAIVRVKLKTWDCLY